LNKTQHRTGSSLIEVMVAMMILVVLVLGVASFIYYGRSGVYAQRDRLSVLELVNGRLEALCAVPYPVVEPPNSDYNVYYTVWSGGTFTLPRLRPRTQRLYVNSRNRARKYQMTTTVQYIDIDGGAASYDALKLTVSMRYHPNSTDEIVLSTYRVP